MKNIHVLPTDKPSRLYYNSNQKHYRFNFNVIRSSNCIENQNIYITSDEEIKEGDYCIDGDDIYGPFEEGDIATVKFIKIILTTDEQLIRYGVQAIDDEFIEWFVKNPCCEEVEVESKVIKDGVWTDLKGYVELPTIHSIIHKIIIPQEEPKQETLEELSNEYAIGKSSAEVFRNAHKRDFIAGFKACEEQNKNMYSEEEVENILIEYVKTNPTKPYRVVSWFQQFKKK